MKNFLLKTKGNYLRSDKKRNITSFIVPIVIAFAVLYGGRDAVAKLATFVTMPVYAVRQYMEESSGTIPVFFRSRNDLDEQIRTLEQEVAKRQGLDTTLLYLMEENKELRQMLQASSSPQILAGVISRPPNTPYDTMIIDQGSDNGIVLNAPVFYGGGQAIGYVERVFARSAQVTLFSSPEVESTVYVFGPNIFTTAYGEGGGIIRLSVPQGITIGKDNVVILPSLESGVLGAIDDIQSIPTEPEQHAYVTLDASLQSIRMVYVGMRPIQKASFVEAESRVQDAWKDLFTVPVPENYTAISSTTSTTSASDVQAEANSAE